MATQISTFLPIVRSQILEPSAIFWTDAELYNHIYDGIKDLWRSITDLKQEHYLVYDNQNVSFPFGSNYLAGVPKNIHKIYMIEPMNVGYNSPNTGLLFKPKPYNDDLFQLARTQDPIYPVNEIIFYALAGQGGPVNAPTIYCAPQVTSTVQLSFVYVPVLNPLTPEDVSPIPGEADKAVVAWAVAWARAKERDDRTPDPAWIATYGAEKEKLLQSLGLRQYQEPTYTNALWQEYW